MGDFDIARLHMERDLEGRRSERRAERYARIEDLDGMVFGMFPIIVMEIGRSGLRVFGDARVHRAGERGVLPHVGRFAPGGAAETIDRNAGDGYVGCRRDSAPAVKLSPAVRRPRGRRRRLRRRSSREPQDGILIVALFEFQAEIDFVAGGIGKPKGTETGAQSRVRPLARLPPVSRFQRRCRSQKRFCASFASARMAASPPVRASGGLAPAYCAMSRQAGIDAIEQRLLLFRFLPGDGGLHQAVAARARGSRVLQRTPGNAGNSRDSPWHLWKLRASDPMSRYVRLSSVSKAAVSTGVGFTLAAAATTGTPTARRHQR